MCLNSAYLILGWKHRDVGNFHNNETHISSMEIHAEMVDMHTLLIWPCQVLFDICDERVESQSFYKSQVYNYTFHQNFCFVHL